MPTAAKQYLLHERKLSEAALHAYGVGEESNFIVFPFYRDNELLLIKKLAVERLDGKKAIYVEKDCEPCCFGWQAIDPNSRVLAITEGELDAITLYQYGIPAVSIPFGVNNDKWISQDFEQLSIYDEIFLCMDNDDAGQRAALAFAERLGKYRCRLVKLPYKDANACLQAGITTEEIQACFAKADYLDSANIKGFETFADAVINKLYATEEDRGYRSFLEKSHGKVLFRPGELSVWCGINGHGKSQFLGQLVLDFMKQSGKVCVASLEMRPEILFLRMAKQAAGFANPSPEYIRAIHQWYAGKGWAFDLVGTAKADKLLEDFLYAKQRHNVDIFVIDSLLKCGIDEDDYNGQKRFVEKLCDFKNEHNVHIHLVAHPRKGDDELTPPNKMNVKGTGSITDLADNVFTIWRNKKKEKEIDKYKNEYPGAPMPLDLLNEYDSLWICDKQRNGDWEKAISLWFDPQSLQFLNSKDQKPKQYVQYSSLNK
jgi:twinkle protein